MDSRKAEHLIPVLQDNFNPNVMGGQLLPHEIQLLVFIDGATTVDGLAQLIGEDTVDVMDIVDTMEKKGVLYFKQAKPAPKASGTYSHIQQTPRVGGSPSRSSISGLRTPSSGSRPSLGGLASLQQIKHDDDVHGISSRVPSFDGQLQASESLNQDANSSSFSVPDSFAYTGPTSSFVGDDTPQGPSTDTDIPRPDGLSSSDHSSSDDLLAVLGAEPSPSNSVLGSYADPGANPLAGEEFPLDAMSSDSVAAASGWPEPKTNSNSASSWDTPAETKISDDGWPTPPSASFGGASAAPSTPSGWGQASAPQTEASSSARLAASLNELDAPASQSSSASWSAAPASQSASTSSTSGWPQSSSMSVTSSQSEGASSFGDLSGLDDLDDLDDLASLLDEPMKVSAKPSSLVDEPAKGSPTPPFEAAKEPGSSSFEPIVEWDDPVDNPRPDPFLASSPPPSAESHKSIGSSTDLDWSGNDSSASSTDLDWSGSVPNSPPIAAAATPRPSFPSSSKFDTGWSSDAPEPPPAAAAVSMDSMEKAEATALMQNHPAMQQSQEKETASPPRAPSRKEQVQERAKKKSSDEEPEQVIWDDDDELMSEDYIKMMVGDNVETSLSMEETRHAAKVLTSFVRVTSSFQLYDPRNDAVRDALVGLFGTLTSFLKKYEVLPLTVEPWEFFYNGESIYRNKEREYSLAFKLFRDGVRGISFRKGVPWPELAKFLRILGVRYHGVHMFEDDIVSLIWKANFDYIETLAVEGFEESEEGYNPTADAETFLTHALEKRQREEEGKEALEEAGENQGYVWEAKNDMAEEDMTSLIQALHPGHVMYEPISHFKASLMQEEVDAQHLPHRVNRLVGYLESEVNHPTHPMSSHALQMLVLEFRDYLLTEERLSDLVELFERVQTWNKVEGDTEELSSAAESDLLDLAFGDEPVASSAPVISGAEALSLVYREFVDTFSENRMIRRLLDASKVDEKEEDVTEETYKILGMLPIDPVPILFELLEVESYQNLKTVMRFMLVRLTNKETNQFRRRLVGAGPEMALELLYCLFMIRDEGAVEAIVSQISNPDPEIQDTVLKLVDRLIKDSGEGLAVRDVINRLIESDDYEVRRRAYVLVEKSGDSRWAAPLLRLFESDPNREEEELRQLARLSAHVNPQKARPIFLELAKPPGMWAMKGSWETPQRMAALIGLAIIGDTECEGAIRTLLRKLGKENEQVRRLCVSAMREIRRRQRGVSSDSMDIDLGSLGSLDGLDGVFDLHSSMDEYSEQRRAEAAAQAAQEHAEAEARREKEAELAQVSGAKEVDISEIQQQMLKALQHSSGGQADFSGQLRRYGYELVLLLHMLIKTSRLYDHDNKIFDKPFEDIAAMMERLIDELGEVALMGVDGSFYINEVRVRLQRDSAEIGQELFDDLARVGVGGITFSIAMTSDEWRTFIQFMVKFSQLDQVTTLEDLKSELDVLGLKHHLEMVGELNYRIGEDENHVKIGQARSVLNAYVKANDATQSLWDSVSVGRIPNPLPVRHASNDFVDALGSKDEVNPLEILSLGEFDNPLNAHVLDTTMYTLMIGKEIGLSSVQLADLSMSAFFHDVGYAVNPEQVNAPSDGIHSMTHSSIGLRFLARQQGFQDSKVKRLLVVVEHHLDAFNAEQRNSPSLFSRIIHVADAYSLLTTPLYEHQQKLSPPHALAVLAGGKGSCFDPLLVQALINVIGKYPPSTLVKLSNGSVAISLGFDGEPAFFDRPRVLVVRMPSGTPCEGPTVDLSEVSQEELSITGVLPDHPEIPVKEIMARILRDRVRLEKQVF